MLDYIIWKYCITYQEEEKENDTAVFQSNSRIFFIDGQEIYADELRSVELDHDIIEPFREWETGPYKDELLAGDSIHFQQLRAYLLCYKLIEQFKEEHSSASKKQSEEAVTSSVRIAIIGGGFSGLTSALTLLNRADFCGLNVEIHIYEHHQHFLPKFLDANRRSVFPNHHIRPPSDEIQENNQWKALSGNPERGGIPNILQWTPGPIDQIVKEVEGIVTTTFSKDSRVCRYTDTKVNHVKPDNERATSPIDVDAQRSPDSSLEIFNLEEESGLHVTKYDAVIIAAGTSENRIEIAGEASPHYWRPNKFEHLPPRPSPERIAIIGAGNTAASEVFNFIVKRGCFAELMKDIQRACQAPMTREELKFTPSGADLQTILSQFKKEFSSLLYSFTTDNLRSENKIQVSLFIRKSETELFSSMNPINRFLILFLNALGYLEIRYVGAKLPTSGMSKEKPSVFISSGLYKMMYGEDIVYPYWKGIAFNTEDYCWSHIYNCTGTERQYYKVFTEDVFGLPDFGLEQNTLAQLIETKIKQQKARQRGSRETTT